MGEVVDGSEDEIGGPVETLGGRVRVVLDERSQVTMLGQLAFFAEYLEATGVFEAWEAECPLRYTSPNASRVRDVLGTWVLSVLSGHRRYAHVTALRGDGVSAQVLGMRRVVSEDALRRALARMPATAAESWLRAHLLRSVRPALTTPWVLDVDTTIKPLFGGQAGAVVSYNPHKPGRPSHALHTYWVSNLRLVLDVRLSAGNEHAAKHALPGLIELLDGLGVEERPELVRGDCGFGNEPVIGELEARGQGYLFKLRQSPLVKRLLRSAFVHGAGWSEPGPRTQGWSAKEVSLRLSSWPEARRVVVLRRPAGDALAAQVPDGQGQLDLAFLDDDAIKVWEYAVLVTNTAHEAQAIAQLYRDRADAENGFDELKNQWGWGGYTTQDIDRCRTSARGVALVYNWWSWYCRAAKPTARMEAITSRPLLLSAVGRSVQHAGQRTLYMSPLHGAIASIRAFISNVRRALRVARGTAEQLPSADPWRRFIDYVVSRITDNIDPIRRYPLAIPGGNCRF
jgi:hypothetical protein